MITDQALNTALRHWGVRAIPFSDNTGEAPFPSPSWEQALGLLEQTAALRSLTDPRLTEFRPAVPTPMLP